MSVGAQECEHLVAALRSLTAARRELVGVVPGLAAPENAVLAVLGRGDARTTDVARALCLDESGISRRAASLVADGLLERVVDPVDGRAHLLHRTDAGTDRWRALEQRLATVLTTAFRGWDAGEVERVAGDLERLADSARGAAREARADHAEAVRTA